MVEFISDPEVEALSPERSGEQLALLIGLLCGQTVDFNRLSAESQASINAFLRRVQEGPSVNFTYEEFNELLLLFNQNRVQAPFFSFFFLVRDPSLSGRKDTVPFSHIKLAVTRFRGFAMLCFGNFRFAFRQLSEETDPGRFLTLLYPWNRDHEDEETVLKARQPPLTPLVGTDDEIEGSETWLLGYISGRQLESDTGFLKQITESSEEPASLSLGDLRTLKDELTSLEKARDRAQQRGRRNTVKYLTWDYMDVYVATSMRDPWEFEETHRFVEELFLNELADFRMIRWFDPTQSFDDSVINKGLVEALMLKRAFCTIYMAQEGDTLGKDSELAATLAQGKPVIAYVREVRDLKAYEKELRNRSLRYLRRRLLTLVAEGFFERSSNRSTIATSAKVLGLSIEEGAIAATVCQHIDTLNRLEQERRFQILGSEETEFKAAHPELDDALKLLAAVESVAADNRAETIKSKHPLAMQVHLESGVANGVLVARTVRECADLVRGVLTGSLRFKIELETGGKSEEPNTVLLEAVTLSRFRVVTGNECLTNSFWNFYPRRLNTTWRRRG